jgi:formate--tetrahydrofolate ligase
MAEIAKGLGIPESALEPYGKTKAKIGFDFLNALSHRPDGKLILVTAMSPTPAGEGKTTTTIGLGDALNRLGRKTAICLREPSLGPVFGMKGGATGGGYAQVIPMEDINLHFTGDFNAIALAHNLLAALIDNHIHHGNALQFDVRRVTWRRVVDMNDRALRKILISLGGPANGFPRESGFDIVVASEVMAILCLATSLDDLKHRLGEIVIGYSLSKAPLRAKDLNAQGPMAVLLKEAIKPNLVQTIEHSPVLMHGGPFANIAHGCNSAIATRAGLKLADYVVTEAGFGADLGAEKFVDIKCRETGLRPQAAVLVATVRALKYHGGAMLKSIADENLSALKAGLKNLEKHYSNISTKYGLPCVIALNRFTSDTESELALLSEEIGKWNAPLALCTHWAEGGKGAEALATQVLKALERPSDFRFVYDSELPLWEKLRKVAMEIYGASDVTAEPDVKKLLAQFEAMGYARVPVCIAKTQYSFSTDAKQLGAPSGHTLQVREVRLAAGAGFVVAVCGDINTMPGLPKDPAAYRMDIDASGKISGLS